MLRDASTSHGSEDRVKGPSSSPSRKKLLSVSSFLAFAANVSVTPLLVFVTAPIVRPPTSNDSAPQVTSANGKACRRTPIWVSASLRYSSLVWKVLVLIVPAPDPGLSHGSFLLPFTPQLENVSSSSVSAPDV